MTTPRLGFGQWRAEDGDLAAALWGDPVVMRLAGRWAAEDVRARLAAELGHARDHGLQYWPVFAIETGAHLGCCGLRPRDAAAGVFELGFQFRADAWGQGYASEAARAVVGWARDHGIAALFAGHHPENAASRNVLLKLGFVYTHDEFYPPTGVIEPCYALPLRDVDPPRAGG